MNKRALLVGMNYYNTSAELKGCLNDVWNIRNMLVSNYGFLRENIYILTDSPYRREPQPTRDNIVRALD